jgi:FAD/FMN-containing dehydrogenase
VISGDILPGVRINPFGHLGDGNIHYNLSPPEGRSGFENKADELSEALALLAAQMGGSFAAEHGLGRAKVALADGIRSTVERALMARLKAALDPSGTMNPGVLVRSPE